MLSTRGFSLIEVTVATALLAVAIVSLAELTGIAVLANRRARDTTYATVLAFQKMEELRGLAAADLAASPPGALDRNTDGFVDYLDDRGVSLGGGTTVPAGTVYIRRWSIQAASGSGDRALVLQVVTITLVRNAETARLVGVRSRP